MSRPRHIGFLSRVARLYDPVVRWMGFTSLWQVLAEVAAPRPGEWTLDVCTGTGGVAFELARRGARVVGVDLAAGMLRHGGRKRRRATHPLFVRMDARRLAFADRTFSLVTCSMALHEMSEHERTQVLSEIARVARDRVVIAEYLVPSETRARLWFRAAKAFEYLESDDFERFVSGDFRARLVDARLSTGEPRDLGEYRIWPCNVEAA